ncbi:uncharacterized protein LOC122501452 isoform X1 [Leptopilina heterotoma]|uniref:uncharacterized protein LOC122501452 isoform X1 n=1 Tax=Leptopilina heterotoma TaxID=63436 RepID=UPI001CAA3E5A|nr:uncharacterized protein LOC122501452 isoform X1 [Leptopilina heterotoma]
MIRKAFICLLISLVYSQNCKLDVTRLSHLEKNLKLNTQKILEKKIGEENAALFMGTARAGKSTLINYIINNKLKATKKNQFEPILIEKADKKSSGPQIGRGSKSKTTIPSKWKSPKLPKLVLWDTPGFDDNRGNEQDITNSYYIKFLIDNLQSLKFIVVIDFDDLKNDSPNPFFTLLRHLEDIFQKDFQNIFSSISVIFAKAPEIWNNYTVDHEFIKEKLKMQFLSSSQMELSEKKKKFILYLIDNVNHTGIFRRAMRIGEVTSDVDYNIFPAIRNSVSLQRTFLQHLKVSVSDASNLCLQNIASELKTMIRVSMYNLLNAMLQVVTTMKKNDLIAIKNESYANYIRTFQKKVIVIKEELSLSGNHTRTLYSTVEAISLMDNKFKLIIDENNILEKIKILAFIDDLLHTQVIEDLEHYLFDILKWLHESVNETISDVDRMISDAKKENNKLDNKDLKLTHTEKEISYSKWDAIIGAFQIFIGKKSLGDITNLHIT